MAGEAIDCADGIACTIDECDEATQGCVFTPDDAYCDDGLYCNGAESCDPESGCMAGEAIVCGDGIACTIDECDEATQG
jgi:hypothetical protein